LKRIKEEETKFFQKIEDIKVTLSYGCFLYNGRENLNLDTIIEKTDAFLYLAKGNYEHELVKNNFNKELIQQISKAEPKIE